MQAFLPSNQVVDYMSRFSRNSKPSGLQVLLSVGKFAMNFGEVYKE